jgi:hypothetical protein
MQLNEYADGVELQSLPAQISAAIGHAFAQGDAEFSGDISDLPIPESQTSTSSQPLDPASYTDEEYLMSGGLQSSATNHNT